MTFIDPSLEKVFQTLIDNDELINHLKQNSLLITKSSLYNDYSPEQVKNMEVTIYTSNVDTLYEVANVLLTYSETIKQTDIWVLLSNKIAWNELCLALGVDPKDLDPETYKLIMFTYKYCTVTSFFQNNRDKFIPEADFYELDDNSAGKAFYDAMMKEFDKLDAMISRCTEYMDYDAIPFDLINYLTQMLGWEKADMNADETTEFYFRELAKNIIDIYRIKGTNFSFELFFNFLGFNIKVKEFYFDRRFYYTLNTAGNPETDNTNNGEYEYYLTVNNPADNVMESLGVSEVVSHNDFSEQYSMLEFNQLCKEYGVPAVLGYSPIYPVYNSNGDLVEYKEYTGKVYKYFKTNVIYYTISLANANPTEKQLSAVSKYLDFLTPSYVMRTIKVDTFSESMEEGFGFDGDGSSLPDAYGNFNAFEMLDSEDWSQHFQDEYVTTSKSGLLQQVDEDNYNGKEETYKTYKNSLGENKFRLPIGGKTLSFSTNRYLTGGTGTPYQMAKRLKYYIVYTIDGKETKDITSSNVVIMPYYTVPPFVGGDNYLTMSNSWEKETKVVNLTGGDGEGGEECVKTQIRDANLKTEVDFITNENIEEFKQDETFSELEYVETFARKPTLVKRVKYGTDTYQNAYEAYLYEFNQSKTKITNISADFSAFTNEIYGKEISIENKGIFENEVYEDSVVTNYHSSNILKDLEYNECFLTYTGTLDSGELRLYRFGNNPMPIIGNPAQYETTYLNYVSSFDYKLVKNYRGSIGSGVNISESYITKNTLLEVEQSIQQSRDEMIRLASESSVENWLPIDYITSRLFYVSAEGEYYRAVKVPTLSGISSRIYNSGKSHAFQTLEEAEAYFETYKEEKVNNAEFYVADTKKLYRFKYKNRTPGKLIYSSFDEKLYYLNGVSDNNITALNNWFGNLSFEFDNNGNITKGVVDKYDFYWKGYDEAADSEDFMFYNSEHKINWPELNITNKVIARPVRYETDLSFDKNLEKGGLKYIAGRSSTEDYETAKGFNYFKTSGQRIVGEISKHTVDNFTAKEHIDWYTETENQKEHPRGLLSIIEESISLLTTKTVGTHEFRYYSKTSDFFQDYYRMFVLGNMSIGSVPSKILEDLGIDIEASDAVNKINAKTPEIKKAYDRAIEQCATILDSISKNRIYYSFVGNWRQMVEPTISDWEVLPGNGSTGDELAEIYKLVYSDPLNNTSFSPKEKYKIGNQYYFDEKTTFVNNIKATIENLKHKYNIDGQDFIRFDIDKDLFGKDAYALEGNYKENDNYKYLYKNYSGNKTVEIKDTFYLTRDSIYNYYIAYSLNYGLKEYSKDYYGEQRDIYSEFTELFDFFHAFAKSSSEADKKKINDFLKEYYYKKLTNLYREAPIEDNLPVTIDNHGRKPMYIYPKLPEYLDGKSGTLSSPGTLLGSYKNNGKSYDDTKLQFHKCEIELKNNLTSAELKFYVTKQNFIDCFGYDLNRYYKNLDLAKLTQAEALSVSAEIEKMYKKQFACVRPVFLFKQDIYKNNVTEKGITLTSWQRNKKHYETEFAEVDFLVVDKNNKDITNNQGYVIDTRGNRLFSANDIKTRLGEVENIILIIRDTVITTGLKLSDEPGSKNPRFFSDISSDLDEMGNIEGYFVVKKLQQKFIDNYISKPYSKDWIERDPENQPTEYVSFGDDRQVNIKITNKFVNDDNYLNYYGRQEPKEEIEHEEEVLQFNQYGYILDKNGKYKELKEKNKTPEDQGINPKYRKVAANKVKANSDGDIALSSTIELDGQEVKFRDDELEIFYNSDGDLILAVPSSKLHTSNISKVKVLFKCLYIIIKKVSFFARANTVFRAAFGYLADFKISKTLGLFTLEKVYTLVNLFEKQKVKSKNSVKERYKTTKGVQIVKRFTGKFKPTIGKIYRLSNINYLLKLTTIGKVKKVINRSSRVAKIKEMWSEFTKRIGATISSRITTVKKMSNTTILKDFVNNKNRILAGRIAKLGKNFKAYITYKDVNGDGKGDMPFPVGFYCKNIPEISSVVNDLPSDNYDENGFIKDGVVEEQLKENKKGLLWFWQLVKVFTLARPSIYEKFYKNSVIDFLPISIYTKTINADGLVTIIPNPDAPLGDIVVYESNKTITIREATFKTLVDKNYVCKWLLLNFGVLHHIRGNNLTAKAFANGISTSSKPAKSNSVRSKFEVAVTSLNVQSFTSTTPEA